MSDEVKERDQGSGLSRRDFLKVSGISLSVPLIIGHRVINVAGQEVKVYGPGKVPISLSINAKKYSAEVEPRVTLLETLRHELDITGAKRVCDRATCGACTVIIDGKPVYSCTTLAIEAHGKKIRTVESLEQNGKLHPVQQAFWDNDAQQCGFCTPGIVMACTALLEKHPAPTPEQIEMGVGGNLCRCGTYVGIKAAIAQASGQMRNMRRTGSAKLTRGGKSNG